MEEDWRWHHFESEKSNPGAGLQDSPVGPNWMEKDGIESSWFDLIWFDLIWFESSRIVSDL